VAELKVSHNIMFRPAIEVILLWPMLFVLYIGIHMANFQSSFLKLQIALEDDGTKYTSILVHIKFSSVYTAEHEAAKYLEKHSSLI
jgi:hypothetical protein